MAYKTVKILIINIHQISALISQGAHLIVSSSKKFFVPNTQDGRLQLSITGFLMKTFCKFYTPSTLIISITMLDPLFVY